MFRIILLCNCLMLLLFAGCNGPATSKNAVNEKPKKLPKLDFHKPESVDASVKRMNAILESICNDTALPAPARFDVVEEFHGNHSHYYLKSKYDSAEHEDHGHEGTESKVIHHSVDVSVFEEFIDIAKWLPAIAANEDFSKSDWDEIQKTSNELEELLAEILKEDDDSAKRKKMRAKKSSVSALISSLPNESKSGDKSSG